MCTKRFASEIAERISNEIGTTVQITKRSSSLLKVTSNEYRFYNKIAIITAISYFIPQKKKMSDHIGKE